MIDPKFKHAPSQWSIGDRNSNHKLKENKANHSFLQKVIASFTVDDSIELDVPMELACALQPSSNSTIDHATKNRQPLPKQMQEHCVPDKPKLAEIITANKVTSSVFASDKTDKIHQTAPSLAKKSYPNCHCPCNSRL